MGHEPHSGGTCKPTARAVGSLAQTTNSPGRGGGEGTCSTHQPSRLVFDFDNDCDIDNDGHVAFLEQTRFLYSEPRASARADLRPGSPFRSLAECYTISDIALANGFRGIPAIPATSTWGFIVLGLLTLVSGTIILRNGRRDAPSLKGRQNVAVGKAAEGGRRPRTTDPNGSSDPEGQRRELKISGPTGRNMKAQGNALGNERIAKMSPERAKQSAQFTALR